MDWVEKFDDASQTVFASMHDVDHLRYYSRYLQIKFNLSYFALTI